MDTIKFLKKERNQKDEYKLEMKINRQAYEVLLGESEKETIHGFPFFCVTYFMNSKNNYMGEIRKFEINDIMKSLYRSNNINFTDTYQALDIPQIFLTDNWIRLYLLIFEFLMSDTQMMLKLPKSVLYLNDEYVMVDKYSIVLYKHQFVKDYNVIIELYFVIKVLGDNVL